MRVWGCAFTSCRRFRHWLYGCKIVGSLGVIDVCEVSVCVSGVVFAVVSVGGVDGVCVGVAVVIIVGTSVNSIGDGVVGDAGDIVLWCWRWGFWQDRWGVCVLPPGFSDG